VPGREAELLAITLDNVPKLNYKFRLTIALQSLFGKADFGCFSSSSFNILKTCGTYD
jgi:hypothetical protein